MANIKYNGSNALTYLLQLLNTKFGTKVDKVTGKGLSTNDLTDSLKANYGAAYTHSTSTHAPTNAERNTIVGIQKNGVDITPDANRKVNVVVPTKTSEITNDSGYVTESQIPPGAVASSTVPKMDASSGAIGTENAFARGDHIHPSDTTKVDKITGKGLSTNDYTTAEKTKLAGIAENANNYVHPGSGTNPHGTTKSDLGLGNVGNFKAVSTEASQGLTDTEKSNARANIGAGTSSFSGNYNDLTNKPTIPTVPTISTDISTDATSDTKTASPKAVKTYVDNKVSTTYKAAGSVVFANLPTPAANLLGNVYNVTDAFTTDNRFVEGAGKSHPAGTNVVVIDAGSSTYKFDVLSGFVDLSPYQKSSELLELTNSEVQAIWDSVFGS